MKSFQELEKAVTEITERNGIPGQAHRIIRELQRIQVIAEAKCNYRLTGKYLPSNFKQELAEKYHFSQKQVEHIVYESGVDNGAKPE